MTSYDFRRSLTPISVSYYFPYLHCCVSRWIEYCFAETFCNSKDFRYWTTKGRPKIDTNYMDDSLQNPTKVKKLDLKFFQFLKNSHPALKFPRYLIHKDPKCTTFYPPFPLFSSKSIGQVLGQIPAFNKKYIQIQANSRTDKVTTIWPNMLIVHEIINYACFLAS